MTLEANKQVVRDFAAAYSRADWDALEALLTEDFRWVVPITPAMQSPLLRAQDRAMTFADRSREETLAQFRYTETQSEGGAFTIEVDRLVAEGDLVAVEARSHAVNKRNGRVYDNQYMWMVRIRDGRIDLFREYQDTLHVFDVWMA